MDSNSQIIIIAITVSSVVLALLIVSPYIIQFGKFLLKKTNFRTLGQSSQIRLIYQLKEACEQLSKDKTGALITIVNKTDLDNYRTDGIALDANISSALLISIFDKHTPLHDGSVIIANNKITYASTYFKITAKSIDNRLGARHRAALGISESTDALAIVVSEQTGGISFAKNGTLTKVTIDEFQEKLVEALK